MRIRRITSKDSASLEKIAFQTGLLGLPAVDLWDDPGLWFDLSCRSFIVFSNDSCWVLEEQGITYGYLLCAKDTPQNILMNNFRLFPFYVLPRLLRGKYCFKKNSLKFALRMLVDQVKKIDFTPFPYDRYPASLHINLSPETRGNGFGTLLMNHALNYLKKKNIPGIHLHTTSYNIAACALYRKMGFTVFSRKATTLWKPWIQQNIFHLIMVRSLTGNLNQ